LLLGIAGRVLILARANVSSPLLARAEVRAREMAVRSALGGSRRRLVRQWLAESAVLALIAAALSVLLVSTAALLISSLLAYYAADLGFERREALLVSLRPPGDEEQGRMFCRQLKERVQALPGVKRVSVASVVPLSPSGTGASQKVFLPQDLHGGADSGRAVGCNVVDPDYFDLLGIPISRGRGFSERDDRGSPPVMMINETMAREFWPKGDPIGQSVRLGSFTNAPFQIVGVVRDTKLNSLDEEPEPYLYLPWAQQDRWDFYLLVESAGKALAVAGPVRAELRAPGVEPAQSDISTMKAFIRAKLWGEELIAQVTAVLGVLGLGLAWIGLYGVPGYVVSQRTREIGVRMALGAQRREVLTLVERRGLGLALIGLALKTPVSVAAGFLCRGFVYGMNPLDPLSLGMSGLLLLVVAGLATFFPARRATKVDPMVALRCD
jgi:putative ABC transport system permease protein